MVPRRESKQGDRRVQTSEISKHLTSTHLTAEHEGDGAVGAGHFTVAQHGREAVQLLGAGGHFFIAIFGQRGGGDTSEP